MRILIASAIDRNAIEQLKQDHEVIYELDNRPEVMCRLIQGCDALVFRSGVSITADLLACSPRLKLLVRAGCGLDNLDLDYVTQHGIKLVRIPQPSAKAVAEMAIALMLALCRNIRIADGLLRQGHWAKHQLESHLLHGKVLGIVGAGNIGSHVGQLGAALGMKPLGCVEKPTTAVIAELRSKGIRNATFDEVVRNADYLSVHVPLSNSTSNLIDAGVLSRMKTGAYLINLARGGVVDEAALLHELKKGRLGGAALDVHQREGEGKISPLAELQNVILTPHIGAMTVETQQDIGRRVIDSIEEFAASQRGRKRAVPLGELAADAGTPAMTD